MIDYEQLSQYIRCMANALYHCTFCHLIFWICSICHRSIRTIITHVFDLTPRPVDLSLKAWGNKSCDQCEKLSMWVFWCLFCIWANNASLLIIGVKLIVMFSGWHYLSYACCISTLDSWGGATGKIVNVAFLGALLVSGPIMLTVWSLGYDIELSGMLSGWQYLPHAFCWKYCILPHGAGQ